MKTLLTIRAAYLALVAAVALAIGFQAAPQPVAPAPAADKRYNGFVTGEFAWHHANGNLISEVQTHAAAGRTPRTVYRPEEFAGFSYNSPSVAASKKNSAAIEQLKKSLSDAGPNLMRVRGNFYTWGKITNPTREFAGLQRQIPFAIEGETPGTQIINLKPGEPAIELVMDSYSYQHPLAMPLLSLRNLDVISQGDGVRLLGPCGRNFIVENLRVGHCKGTGFYAKQVYGGKFDVHAFHNETGVVIESSNRIEVDLVAMWNRGTGVVMNNGGGVDGTVFSEGNGGWGLDYDNVTGSQRIHQEGNRHGNFLAMHLAGDKVQSRLRNCGAGLALGGYMWSNFGLDFETDPISRLGVSIERPEDDAARNERLARYALVTKPLGESLSVIPQFWAAGLAPDVAGKGAAGSQEAVEIKIPAGGYSAVEGFASSNAWIELYSRGPLEEHEFQAGDWLEIAFDVELDAAAAAYFAKHPQQWAGRIICNFGPFSSPFHAGGPLFVRDATRTRFRVAGPAGAAGKGVRLFWLPLESAEDFEPPAPHTVTLSNLTIAVVPAAK